MSEKENQIPNNKTSENVNKENATKKKADKDMSNHSDKNTHSPKVSKETEISKKEKVENQSKVKKRSELKKEKQKHSDEEESRAERKRERKGRIRMFPIWVRLLLVILLLGGSLIIGLMVGFGVVGGHEPLDAIRPETWYHILDLMRGEVE